MLDGDTNVRTHRSGEEEEDYTTNITQQRRNTPGDISGGEIELYIRSENEIRTSIVYIAGSALSFTSLFRLV